MNPNIEKQLELLKAEWDIKRMIREAEFALLRAGMFPPSRPQEGTTPPTIPQSHVFPVPLIPPNP